MDDRRTGLELDVAPAKPEHLAAAKPEGELYAERRPDAVFLDRREQLAGLRAGETAPFAPWHPRTIGEHRCIAGDEALLLGPTKRPGEDLACRALRLWGERASAESSPASIERIISVTCAGASSVRRKFPTLGMT